jgi:hypothetical protein
MIFVWTIRTRTYKSRTLLRIMSFFQIIIYVDISVSVSYLVYVLNWLKAVLWSFLYIMYVLFCFSMFILVWLLIKFGVRMNYKSHYIYHMSPFIVFSIECDWLSKLATFCLSHCPQSSVNHVGVCVICPNHHNWAVTILNCLNQ